MAQDISPAQPPLPFTNEPWATSSQVNSRHSSKPSYGMNKLVYCRISSVMWRGVAWRGVAWRGVAWRGVAWRGVAWRGVAWRGVVWRGVAWRGVAWRGVVWRGVA